MTAKHAKLSPSASSRWMTCPGSVKLIEDNPMPRSSSAAGDRGTAIHELSEVALTNSQDCSEFLGETIYNHVVDKDMVECGQVYVDYVRTIPGRKFYEQRVSVESLIPGCYGTADCIVIDGELLHVIDLKTGVYPVVAEDNTQLLIYSLGAYYKYKKLYDIQRVRMTIVQPQISETPVSHEVSVTELLAFEKVLIDANIAIEKRSDVFVISEDACKYCPVKALCPAHGSMAQEAAKADFAQIKSSPEANEKLSYWLDKIKLIKDFVSAVEDEAKARLEAGDTIPGYKLVDGRKSREWTDEEKLKAFIKRKRLTSVMFETKLLSVAQAEKVLKGKDVDITEFVKSVPGKPTYAKEADKRSDIASAATDFKKVDSEKVTKTAQAVRKTRTAKASKMLE